MDLKKKVCSKSTSYLEIRLSNFAWRKIRFTENLTWQLVNTHAHVYTQGYTRTSTRGYICAYTRSAATTVEYQGGSPCELGQ